MSIRDDLGSVKGLLEVVDELLLVALESLLGWSSKDLGSPDSLVLQGRETSSKDGLSNEGNWHTLVEGVNGGPLSGSLLSSSVENFLDHWDTVSVVEFENVSGDFHQERVEDTILPLEMSLSSRNSSDKLTLAKISPISASSRPRPRLRMS